jgi:type 1 fimbriae regulatory protein FimB/type 1 fimbriae regulatory protein FimE
LRRYGVRTPTRAEHLTEAEVERLIAAAKGNRHGHRDATMILVAYRHGLGG